MNYTTDKIGFAAFLILRGFTLAEVKSLSRNRATFTFGLPTTEAEKLEDEFTRSQFASYFSAFKLLRERTVRGVMSQPPKS